MKQRADLLHLRPEPEPQRPNDPALQKAMSELRTGSGSWELGRGPVPGAQPELGDGDVVEAPPPLQAAPPAVPLRSFKAQQSLGAVTSLQEMLGGLIGGPGREQDPPVQDPAMLAPPSASEEGTLGGAGHGSDQPDPAPVGQATAGGTLRHRTSASGRISSSGH